MTNLASRLADEATAGQILIAQRLYAEVEDDVEVEPVGEFTLKGFQRPVAALASSPSARRRSCLRALRSRAVALSSSRAVSSALPKVIRIGIPFWWALYLTTVRTCPSRGGGALIPVFVVAATGRK